MMPRQRKRTEVWHGSFVFTLPTFKRQNTFLKDRGRMKRWCKQALPSAMCEAVSGHDEIGGSSCDRARIGRALEFRYRFHILIWRRVVLRRS